MTVVIALDAGTTGVRAMAVSAEGCPLHTYYREFPQYFPRPGWVEHDATEIWEAVSATLADLLAVLAEPIGAIGITNQRETTILWDRRDGRPLHRAIVWQDRRTASICEELRDSGRLDLVRSRTGLVLDPYFSGTKLKWLFEEGGIEATPDVAFGTVDSWLIWCLTGGAAHVTDPTNASRTMLYDIDAMRWDSDLTALLGVAESVLPEVGPSSGRLAVTAPGAVPGLEGGIPISGVVGDQQAALFGQACFVSGMTKNTYGTGSFVLMNVGSTCPAPVDGLLTTVAWSLSGQDPVYAFEGAIFVTGAAIQWLRDGLGMITDASEVGPLAATVADSGGAYLVPAFTGMGSPWWDPDARGTLVGMTRGVGRAHLARAVVEAMTFQTRDVVELMSAASGLPIAELRVDGGAAVMDLLLSLQADQLGVPVVRSAVKDTTALGAAFLAGLAEGMWSSPEEISAIWAADGTFRPAGDRSGADASHLGWIRAVERSRTWSRPAELHL